MYHSSTLTLCGFVAACAPFATAQSTSGSKAPAELLTETFPWPDALGTPSFGRAEAGQITADRIVDIVVTRGPAQPLGGADDVAALVYGPASHQVICPLPGFVADFAVVPGAGPDGRDAIALVRATGVELATVENDSDSFTLLDLKLPTFAGAVRLRAFDFDHDGDHDLVALAHDRKQILYAENQGKSFLAAPPFDCAFVADASELVITQDATVPGAKLAIRSQLGLHFCELDLASAKVSEVAFYAASGPEGPLTSLDQKGKVAWIASGPLPHAQTLVVCDPHGIAANPALVLGEGMATVVCGDVDADLDLDVVVGRTTIAGPRVFFSSFATSGTHYSSSATATFLSPAVAAKREPLQQAWPVIRDLDGDGDTEIFLACEQSRQLSIVDGAAFIDTSGAPTPKVVAANYVNTDSPATTPASDGSLLVTVAIPTGLDPTLRIEALVWRQSGWNVPVATAATFLKYLDQSQAQFGHLTFSVPIADDGAFPFDAVYWISLRFVQLDPVSSGIVVAHPSVVLGYGATHPRSWVGPSFSKLIDLPGSGAPIPVQFLESLGGLAKDGAVLCGGLVPRAKIPFQSPSTKIPRPKPEPPAPDAAGG